MIMDIKENIIFLILYITFLNIMNFKKGSDLATDKKFQYFLLSF